MPQSFREAPVRSTSEPSHAVLQRDIGRMEGRLEALERELHETKELQQAMANDLKAISTTLSEAKGGWRTLIAVAGAGGVGGAVLTKLTTLVPNLPLPK